MFRIFLAWCLAWWAILGLLIWRTFSPWVEIGMIAFLVVPFIGTALFIKWSRELANSRFTIQRFLNPAYKEYKCEDCTMGSQAGWTGKNGRTVWGPIPEKMRMIQDGVMYFNSPHANIRKCTTCGGRGELPGLRPGWEDKGWLEVS